MSRRHMIIRSAKNMRILSIGFLMLAFVACSKQPGPPSNPIYPVIDGVQLEVVSAEHRVARTYDSLWVSCNWIGNNPYEEYDILINYPSPFTLVAPQLRSWYSQDVRAVGDKKVIPIQFGIAGPLPESPTRLLITMVRRDNMKEKHEVVITAPTPQIHTINEP